MPQRFIEESRWQIGRAHTLATTASQVFREGKASESLQHRIANPENCRRGTSIRLVCDHLTAVRSCANCCRMPFPFLMIVGDIGLTAPLKFTDSSREGNLPSQT